MMLSNRVLSSCGRIAVRAAFSAVSAEFASSCTTAAPLSCGRVTISRSFEKSSIRHKSAAAPPSGATDPAPTSTPSSSHSAPIHVIARCAGFPKDMLGGKSTSQEHFVYGDDALFVASFKDTVVAGVADGVGGWRKYGVDPSEVSRRIMKECEKRVQQGKFEPGKPEKLIAAAFKSASKPPRPVGSTTACVLVLSENSLYSANLGDSGFLVVRAGKIVARSREQTHYFNAPYQLTLPPDGFEGFLGDSPLSADRQEMRLVKNDVIVLATDGVWDNLPESELLSQIRPLSKGEGGDVQKTDAINYMHIMPVLTIKVEGARLEDKLVQGSLRIIITGKVCNSLALTARRLAFDECHKSPFEQKAREHGINAPGGKPDDIAIVLILVG